MTIPWGAIVLAILQLAVTIYSRLQDKKLIDAGYDKAIAENAAQILKNSKYAKQIMANVNNLSPSDVDNILQQLEPKD